MRSSLDWNIGVCSWSLGNDLESLSSLKQEIGISTVHLHIRPELGSRNLDFIEHVLNNSWNITCGMVSFEQEDYSTLDTIKTTGGIVPNQYWSENKSKVCNAVDILSGLNVPCLSFHFGFLDTNNIDLLERVKVLADYAGSKGVMLLMETGQESAQELADFIGKINHPAVGINFDPANMILYGKGEPVKSLQPLKSWLKNVHVKDAITSPKNGCWGKEVPWGQGEVNSGQFLTELVKIGYQGALHAEREQGTNKYADIISAISKIRKFLEK